MKLIIDIPEEDYTNIEPFLNGATIRGGFNLFKTLEIIKNGTPLPKGHGRLGDLDAVMSDISTSIEALTKLGIAVEGDLLWAKLNDAIDGADTIIEADKESEDRNDRDNRKTL